MYNEFKEDPEIKTRELKKRVFEAFGIKDTEKLIKSEEEIMQEQQEELAAQEELQAMLAGGGGLLPGMGGGIY